MKDKKNNMTSIKKKIFSRTIEKSLVLKIWQENKASVSYQLRKFIWQQIREALPEIGKDLSLEKISLAHPVNQKFGDYTTNIALMLAGKLKQSPKVLAEKIVERINESLGNVRGDTGVKGDKGIGKIGEILEKAEVAGGGFINLWLQKAFLITQLSRVLTNNFGSRITPLILSNASYILDGKKIMIEFAHPNTHKEFHIGHLRNISIGESIVRTLQSNGGKLFRANYEGDVGLHVAKAIWGVRNKISNYQLPNSNKLPITNEQKRNKILEELRKMTPQEKAKFLGEAYAFGSRAYEEDENSKKEIINLNKQIYKDPKEVELWEETRGWSLSYFDWIYKRLGSHFDRLFFESEVEARGRQLVIDNVATGIFVKDKDGSIYFPGDDYGLNNCVFVTREQYATYEGKDVALEDLEYQVFPYDLDIHVVANEQKNFFQIAFAALEAIFPYQKGRQYHLSYGMVNLKGAKLSSRTGGVITADYLIDQAKKKIKEIMKSVRLGSDLKNTQGLTLSGAEIDQIAEKVAVGAVKYSMLRVNPKMDIAFDLEESVSLEGDSGPYLQYTYARCKSVLRKAIGTRQWAIGKEVIYQNIFKEYQIISEEESILLRSFMRFPEVVSEAGRTLSPNLIGSYLFDLAQKYNLFYNKHSILNPEVEEKSGSDLKGPQGLTLDIKMFRLAITSVTANILQQGLYLLGIETVERM